MYCFWGISLATQHYINPSIDIIKRKGVLSSESMNATLLAMTNSAAESFIIMCSIWFGVSDIGISTVVQQAAFYSLIIQGKFIHNYNFLHRCILPLCWRRWFDRLVDHFQRDCLHLALSFIDDLCSLRKQDWTLEILHPLHRVHRAHLPHEVLQ